LALLINQLMTPEIVLKVLTTIHANGELTIPKIFLGPGTGFNTLRKFGYITICKRNTRLYITLSEKGSTYIQTQNESKIAN